YEALAQTQHPASFNDWLSGMGQVAQQQASVFSNWKTVLEQHSPYPDWVLSIFSPITFDARPYLVNYLRPNEVSHPLDSARYIIAATLVVFVLVVLMAIPRMMRTGRHWRVPKQGAAWLGVFGVLALSWYSMNDSYLKHKTIVTFEHRWVIPSH